MPPTGPTGGPDHSWLLTPRELLSTTGPSVSAEHGLDTTRRAAAAARQGAVERDLARTPNQALDTRRPVTPGKCFPHRDGSAPTHGRRDHGNRRGPSRVAATLRACSFSE